jgi:DNA-binding transcriptional ArsR family regulator
MPVRIDTLEDGRPLPVKPGTNAHELLSVLVDTPDLAFSAGELAELTDVPPGSVSKTLSRLEDDGLVRRIDGYWAATDDVTAKRVASLVSLGAIADRYGDDGYGRNDEWAEDLPDLGENA